MSQIGDAIQAKCLAFGDRIIKLNDYLLEQAASSMSDVGGRKPEVSKGKSAFRHQTSDIRHPTSYIKHQTSSLPSTPVMHQPCTLKHYRGFCILSTQSKKQLKPKSSLSLIEGFYGFSFL